jgi:hypothetical protein
MSGITCLAHLYFFVLAICQKIKFTKVELIIVISTAFIGTILKILCPAFIGIIFDIWQLVLLPLCFAWKSKKALNVVIANVLLFIFQFISMITKNIGFGILGDSMLEGTLFSIDVILMLILYYGYANVINRKERKNGKVFWLASMRRCCRTQEDERTGKDRRGEESDR